MIMEGRVLLQHVRSTPADDDATPETSDQKAEPTKRWRRVQSGTRKSVLSRVVITPLKVYEVYKTCNRGYNPIYYW